MFKMLTFPNLASLSLTFCFERTRHIVQVFSDYNTQDFIVHDPMLSLPTEFYVPMTETCECATVLLAWFATNLMLVSSACFQTWLKKWGEKLKK